MEKFIKNIARGAGKILREGFRTKMQVSTKSTPTDYVTEYDRRTEDFIIQKLKKKFPSHGVIGEETGYNAKKKKNFWVIDPLDGTHAYIKGIPQFSTTFAFVSNNIIKYGVVYDPMADELFFAVKGKGSFLNNKKISIAKREDLADASIAPYVASGLWNKGGQELRAFLSDKIVIPHNMWDDGTSSVALGGAYCAAGRFDIIFSKGLNPWDIAASALILKEAGAKVTDEKGDRYKWRDGGLLGANPFLHKKLLVIFKNYGKKI